MNNDDQPTTTGNDESKPATPMETLKQEASACCGSGCDCHSSGPSSRCRWIVGVIVLVAAGVLVARAMVKNDGVPADAGASEFVAVTSPAVPNPPTSEATLAIREIAAISDLNTLAMDTDAVFVYLPGKEETDGTAPTAAIQSATQTIESKAGQKVGVFALKVDAPEYAVLAEQGAVPGVLAMVKGRGMSAVSGEITEAKLVQAFVGASSSGGGCGGATGCGPAAAGCSPAAPRVGPLR